MAVCHRDSAQGSSQCRPACSLCSLPQSSKCTGNELQGSLVSKTYLHTLSVVPRIAEIAGYPELAGPAGRQWALADAWGQNKALMQCVVVMRRPPARYPPIIRSTTARSCPRCWRTSPILATIIPSQKHHSYEHGRTARRDGDKMTTAWCLQPRNVRNQVSPAASPSLSCRTTQQPSLWRAVQ